MTHSEPTFIHLSDAGVSLLLSCTTGGPLQVVHWGAALGDLTAQEAAALHLASRPARGINDVDVPTELTLPVVAAGGYNGRPGVSGSRHGRNWSPRWVVGGADLAGDNASELIESGPGEALFTLVDDEAELALALRVRMHPGGLVSLQAELTNHGEVYDLQDLVLALPVPARAEELLDFAGRWSKERVPQRIAFPVGAHVREGRKGRTGADAATVLHAGTTGFDFATGETWGVHVGWSGNHTHYAESSFLGYRVIGGGELLLPGEVRLATGEKYTSPWVFAAYGTGLDQVAARFHTYQRARQNPVDTNRPVTLNVWEAVYFDHNLERLLDLAQRAADLGVERFVLDDGWFGSRRDDTSGLGDWVVSQDMWPDGLGPLVDRVVDLGMQFGLWFEPEMVNPDSDVARAHPEWIMSARKEWPVETRNQQVLNLAIPECFTHVLEQMSAVLNEYRISYIKWDHNRDLVEAGDQTRGGRPAVHEQTRAAYRLMAELKRRFPHLEIESCSSGGARVDLGVMEHADRVWVSDCIDPLERQQMMRWTAQLLPPEYLGSHIASGRSHTTGRTHDLGFRAATAVFGHLGIEWDLAQASDDELAELREWIAFHKKHRDLLLGGTLVRLDRPGDGALVHGVVSPDQSRAIFAYVLTATPLAYPAPRFVLRGLDPACRYRVTPQLIGTEPSGLLAPPWWAGESRPQSITLPGSALMATGVVPPRMHPDQAMLFLVEGVDA